MTTGTPETPHRGEAGWLRYPTRSLVLLCGIPGAGKSTLLNRLYGLDGTETATVRTRDDVRVVDSQQSRNRLASWLRTLPYPGWRWVAHILHYLRIVLALHGGGPVVAHATGTRRAGLVVLGGYCRLAGIEVHVVLIDAAPEEARAGQLARGRRLSDRSHRAHARRWNRAVLAGAGGDGTIVPGARSTVLLDRTRAHRLPGIAFTAGARARAGLTE